MPEDIGSDGELAVGITSQTLDAPHSGSEAGLVFERVGQPCVEMMPTYP